MKKRQQKVKSKFSIFVGRSLNILLIGLLLFQVAQFVIAPKRSFASTEPKGEVKSVIVQFRGQSVNGDREVSITKQQAELSQRQQWLSNALDQASGYKKLTRTYSQLPFAAYDVDAEGEASLRANPNVVAVSDDKMQKVAALPFATTPGVLEGDWETGFSDGTDGFTGEGYAVAVLDTGVDKTHPSLDGTVVSEACYGVNQEYVNAIVTSACPGGATSSTASGSGEPCEGVGACDHGTMVASMVAMQPTEGMTVESDPVEASGIAKDAKIIAIKVFSEITEKSGQPDLCGNPSNQTQTCYLSLASVQLAGFNRVLELHNAGSLDQTIVAANLSAGGAPFTDSESTCTSGSADMSALNAVAASLENVNIATIVAAGNNGNPTQYPSNVDKLASPGCLSNVIAVSASTADDHMTTYTNAGSLTDLVAPGGEASGSAPHTDGGLWAAKPGEDLENQYDAVQGTSFAAPIVAATWAVIREKAPNASVEGILEGLKDTGVDVVEDRDDYTGMTHKRIDIAAALAVADDFPQFVPTDDEPGTDDPGNTDDGNNSGTDSDTEWVPGVPAAGIENQGLRLVLISMTVALLGVLNLRKRTAVRT